LKASLCLGDIEVVENFPNLHTLSFKNTNITGDIKSLAKLKSLRDVSMGHTQVYGDIANFDSASKLMRLDLSHTNAYGRIPTQLSTRQGIELLLANTECRSSMEKVTVHTAQFPFTLIRSSDLLDMERLPRHEDAAKQGVLCHAAAAVDMNSKFKRWRMAGSFTGELRREDVAFCSHRWLTPDPSSPGGAHPDDQQNSKLNHIKAIVRKHPEVKAWWIDYISVPQDDPDALLTAVFSLPHYVKCCGYFFGLIDETHALGRYHLTGAEGWSKSGWCRLERLAACVPFRDKAICWNPSLGRYEETGEFIKFTTTAVISHCSDLREETLTIGDPSSYDPLKATFWDDHRDDIPNEKKDRARVKHVRNLLFSMYKAQRMFQDSDGEEVGGGGGGGMGPPPRARNRSASITMTREALQSILAASQSAAVAAVGAMSTPSTLSRDVTVSQSEDHSIGSNRRTLFPTGQDETGMKFEDGRAKAKSRAPEIKLEESRGRYESSSEGISPEKGCSSEATLLSSPKPAEGEATYIAHIEVFGKAGTKDA